MFKKLVIFFYNLDLKKALVILFIVSLFLAIPLIYFVSQREKANFSEAGNNEAYIYLNDESLIPYPENPPKIINVTKFYGKAGDSILILGENFGQAKKDSQVFFNSDPVFDTDVKYWSDSEIEVALPPQIGIYRIKVVVNNKEASWYGKVYVYDTQTKPVVEFKPDKNFLKVKDVDQVIAYTISGSINVFGVRNVKNIKKEIPLSYTDSNVLYFELIKDGSPILFRVIED